MTDAIVITILLVIVFSIVRGFVKDKAKGVSGGCGCGCSNCSMASQCHANMLPEQE